MGRQIEFHFHHRDEEKFLEVLEGENIVLLARSSHQPTPREYGDFETNPAMHESRAQSYICFTDSLNGVNFIPIRGGEWYILNETTSPVIEYDRSGIRPSDNLMIPGRIWYEHKYWSEDEDGNDVLVEKSEELRKLFNRLMSWVRRRCTRMPNGKYMAPHAMQAFRTGAKLP